MNLNGNALTRYDVDRVLGNLYQKNGLETVYVGTDLWGLRKLCDFYEGFVEVPTCLDGWILTKIFAPSFGQVLVVSAQRPPKGVMHLGRSDEILERIEGYSTSC